MAALLRRGLHRHSRAGKLNAVTSSLASAVFSAPGVWKFARASMIMMSRGGGDDERNAFARIAADKKLIFGKGRLGGGGRIVLLLVLFGPSCLGACGETAWSLSATSQTLDLSVQGPR